MAGVFVGWALAVLVLLGVVCMVVRLLDDGRVLFSSAVILALATCIPPVWAMFVRRAETVSDLRLLVPLDLADPVGTSNPEGLCEPVGSFYVVAPHSAFRRRAFWRNL
jgi:hypothetical protein